MNQVDFVSRWRAEQPVYLAWGSFVTDSIRNSLSALDLPKPVDEFIRIPAKPRLKTDASLLEKAYYRNKGYQNPYAEITDKVGTRFVVLLETDIALVCKAVTQNPAWKASRDKDFEDDRAKYPDVFAYQSTHFVVSAAQDIRCGDTLVPAGTPCEVQIRTLLQHAHSELTHDTIYKPKTNASPATKRFVAQSMALIEAVDGFFIQVMKQIDDSGEPLRKAMNTLSTAFERNVGRAPEASKLNAFVLDAFGDQLPLAQTPEFESFLASKRYIAKAVASRADRSLLFRQPAVLFVYYLVWKYPHGTKERWPLTTDELQLIYEDLGFAFDD